MVNNSTLKDLSLKAPIWPRTKLPNNNRAIIEKHYFTNLYVGYYIRVPFLIIGVLVGILIHNIIPFKINMFGYLLLLLIGISFRFYYVVLKTLAKRTYEKYVLPNNEIDDSSLEAINERKNNV